MASLLPAILHHLWSCHSKPGATGRLLLPHRFCTDQKSSLHSAGAEHSRGVVGTASQLKKKLSGFFTPQHTQLFHLHLGHMKNALGQAVHHEVKRVLERNVSMEGTKEGN